MGTLEDSNSFMGTLHGQHLSQILRIFAARTIFCNIAKIPGESETIFRPAVEN